MSYILKSSNIMPKFGIGTWRMGENENKSSVEINAVYYALKNGVRLIDTAEMYGEGGAEIIVGEALKKANINRKELFIVSKVYPHNAGRDNLFTSLKKSLSRLGLDYLDMYLLHWRGRVPLRETVECMEEAKKEGLIKDWGVSNFDIDDMKELESIKNGDKCNVNQVLYHLASRGVDFDLASYMLERNIVLMAYCPLAQAGNLGNDILNNSVIKNIAKKHNATSSQIALAFIMYFDKRVPIPKSSSEKHILENINSQNIILDKEDIELLNKEFPKPNRKMPLDIV